MKKLRLFIISLIIVSITAASVPALAAAEDPEIRAAAALLVEPETGTVLYSLNASTRRPPASLTKLMTALLTAEAIETEKISPDDVITVTDDMFADVSSRSSLKFAEGEKITVSDALHCCLIASINESCNMLACAVSGSREAFVEAMNERAAALGCTGTHFVNTHGLPDEDHYSTAEDMYLIFSETMKHDIIGSVSKKTEYSFPAPDTDSGERKIDTTDKLLVKKSFYYYEDAVYGKTGSTNEAGYCLASCAESGNIRLVSVVLGAEGIINEDSSTTILSFFETRRLFRWGFENFGYRTIIDTADLICEIPVELGDGANSVVLRPDSEVTVYMDLTVPVDSIERSVELYSEGLRAPVEAGEVCGRLTLKTGSTTLGEVDLITNTSVPLMHLAFIKAQIDAFFGNIWVKLMLLFVALVIAAYILYVIFYVNRRRLQRGHRDENAHRPRSEKDAEHRTRVRR